MSSISIVLSKTKSPTNKVEKSLTNETTVSGVTFFEENSLDVQNPKLLLHQSTSELADYNYCEIPSLNRYYYITRVSTDGALTRIELKSDPLMSFKKDILASKQYVTRNARYRSQYQVDPIIPLSAKTKFVKRELDDSLPVFDKHCAYVILETAGVGGEVIDPS